MLLVHGLTRHTERLGDIRPRPPPEHGLFDRGVLDAIRQAAQRADRARFREGDPDAVRSVYRSHVGVALGTVKSRSFRAHKRLAAMLGHLRE